MNNIIYFVVFINFVLNSNNIIAAQSNSNDYVKREHSLVKPYQGTNAK